MRLHHRLKHIQSLGLLASCTDKSLFYSVIFANFIPQHSFQVLVVKNKIWTVICLGYKENNYKQVKDGVRSKYYDTGNNTQTHANDSIKVIGKL